MNTAFSHALRLVVCGACNAANHAPPGGGELSCDVCGEVLQVAPRSAPEQSSPPDEAARMDALQSQVEREIAMPADVAALLGEALITHDSAQSALMAWQRARPAIVAGASSEAEGRFYFLTRTLYRHMRRQRDDMQMRAVVETSMDAMHGHRYRQVLRCLLAREAARGDDLTAAEEWLMPCDVRSSDIHADAEYRYTAAYLATHAGRHDEVLRLLGARHDQVALPTSFDAICSVLRADALDRCDRVDDAVTELAACMERTRDGVETIPAMIRGDGSLELCPRSFKPAEERVSERPPALVEEIATLDKAPSKLPWLLVGTLLVVLLVLVVTR